MRFLTLLAASAFITNVHAQIPNGGFESWYSNVNYMEPTSWWTTNMVTWALSATPSCVQSTPGAVGNYHIAVTSMTAGSIVEIGRATCGNEFTGYPGFAYAGLPATFDGQVQYAPQGGDVGQVHAALWGWNANMTSREVIAVATYNITSAIPSWQPFSIPFSYLTQNMPDTARVFIVASGNTPVDGSTIRVDDLHFDGSTSVVEPMVVQGFTVYPSIVTEQVTIAAAEQLARVTVCDASGRVVMEQAPNAQQLMLDVSAWPAGVYAVRTAAVDGRMSVQRIVKQ